MKFVALTLLLAAAGAAHAAELSCRENAGRKQANVWVRQCIMVSPATHPPCNAANSCDMITDEIRRSCIFLADGKASVPPDAPVINDPKTRFCGEYLQIER